VTEARFAIQDPVLRDAPGGVEQYGGHSIGLVDVGLGPRATSDIGMPHGTYGVDLPGQYVGGFETPVPRSLLFPEWYKGRRDAGKALATDNRAFQMTPTLQPLNAEWLDSVMNYLESNRTR
jgi:hypothetical protein